ncbi:universal stress protein [Spongiivirga citrea]|uniref:Universal stress protein n=1 Tax=Spongiivirga citrea TaxID=1481457 RepID=A0A6M0CLV8_9FLAO|nr:universal stress protein [Spongiivirga citrea]NER16819.1 universal stress protein [Spongiivirga citrea]
MNKTILFATDGKEHSAPALKYAHFISNALNAALVVLHVYDIPIMATSRSSRSAFKIGSFAEQEHLEILQSFCAHHLGHELDKMNVRARVVNNVSISSTIISEAKELFVDMVIVGTKNQDSDRGFLSGNIAKTLTGKLDCPLLVLPADIETKKPQTIVYATDFEEEDIYSIKKLIPIVAPFKPAIKIVHISPDSEYSGYDQMAWFKEMLLQKVTYDNMSFDIFFSDDVYGELCNYLDKINADMIAMLEREDRGFFQKIIHRDLVKKMESQTTIPLICFTKTF